MAVSAFSVQYDNTCLALPTRNALTPECVFVLCASGCPERRASSPFQDNASL